MPNRVNGTAQRQNGGAKPTIFRAALNGLTDIAVTNYEVEETERAVMLMMRRNLSALNKRDRLQERAYARLRLLIETIESFERAIDQAPAEVKAWFRRYTAHDPSTDELDRLAQAHNSGALAVNQNAAA